jgi:hypothetical protein
MPVKLRKYQRFFHFSIAWFAPVCNGRSRQGDEITCRQTTLTQKDHDHGHEEEVEEEEGGEEVLIGLMPISQEIASPSDSRDAHVVCRPSGRTKVRPLCFWVLERVFTNMQRAHPLYVKSAKLTR